MKNKFGLGNRITPYKGRTLDMERPVLVYRRLRSKGVNYSLKQDNRVVAHSDCLMLGDVEFIVSKAGNERVRRTKEKNVHAFAKGKIAKRGGMGMTAEECEKRNEQMPQWTMQFVRRLILKTN